MSEDETRRRQVPGSPQKYDLSIEFEIDKVEDEDEDEHRRPATGILYPTRQTQQRDSTIANKQRRQRS